MWFEDTPNGGTVAHEAFHSVIHALTTKCLGRPCDANEEAYAYLIGWTVQEIAKRVW